MRFLPHNSATPKAHLLVPPHTGAGTERTDGNRIPVSAWSRATWSQGLKPSPVRKALSVRASGTSTDPGDRLWHLGARSAPHTISLAGVLGHSLALVVSQSAPMSPRAVSSTSGTVGGRRHMAGGTPYAHRQVGALSCGPRGLRGLAEWHPLQTACEAFLGCWDGWTHQ